MDFNNFMASVDPSIVGVALLVGSYTLSRLLAQNLSKPKIKVSEIWIYPIKSCKGFKANTAKVCKTGFEYDRMFMLADAEGKFISQRSHPKMALIETSLNEAAGVQIHVHLTLNLQF